nr:immunoglobulin heavy chain junction region [Mus musculus]
CAREDYYGSSPEDYW